MVLNSTNSVQEGTGFSRLPREIRDKIYADVLATTYFKFRVDEIYVVASPRTYPWHDPDDAILPYIRGPYEHTQDHHDDANQSRGLPTWIRTCKLICSDVSNMIKRDWVFQAAERVPRLQLDQPVPSNSLVFHTNSIRRVKIISRVKLADLMDAGWRASRMFFIDEERTEHFLGLLSRLRLHETTLALHWERGWKTDDWLPGEPEVWFKEWWGDEWNGKFREVKITIVVLKHELMLEELMQVADSCVRRLVGDQGRVTWRDLGQVEGTQGSSKPKWSAHVIAERALTQDGSTWSE